jgi:acetoin utilization protein AcuB
MATKTRRSARRVGRVIDGGSPGRAVAGQRSPKTIRSRRRKPAPSSFEVGRYMTRTPYTIGPDRPLSEAHSLMRANLIRHLPVVRDGKLVGIVSQRDLLLIEALPDVGSYVPVADALIKDVFAVAPDEPLGAVCATMAARKLGSAVVIEAGQVVGVFTATDACHVLAGLLGYRRGRR